LALFFPHVCSDPFSLGGYKVPHGHRTEISIVWIVIEGRLFVRSANFTEVFHGARIRAGQIVDFVELIGHRNKDVARIVIAIPRDDRDSFSRRHSGRKGFAHLGDSWCRAF
jgi:hypothetical protein